MDKQTFEDIKKDIATAAKTVSYAWPTIVDRDDVEQGIWLRLLEAGDGTIDKLAEMDQALRIRSLTEIGHQLAAKERDDYEYFSGNATYGTEMVRKFLKAGVFDFLVFDGKEAWSFSDEAIGQMRFLQRPDSVSVTAMIDLTLGLKALFESNSSYAAEIINRYQYGIKPVDVNGRRKLSRAVDALTREMNSINRRRRADYAEGPGTREVISNVDALKRTRHDYNRG